MYAAAAAAATATQVRESCVYEVMVQIRTGPWPSCSGYCWLNATELDNDNELWHLHGAREHVVADHRPRIDPELRCFGISYVVCSLVLKDRLRETCATHAGANVTHDTLATTYAAASINRTSVTDNDQAVFADADATCVYR